MSARVSGCCGYGAKTFAKDRLSDAAEEIQTGPAALLPRSEQEVWLTRAWLGWREIGRADPAVGRVIAEADDTERGLLAMAVPDHLDNLAVDTLMATLHGLREALCATERPMPLGQAQRSFSSACAALSPSAAPAAIPAEADSAAERSAVTIASGSSTE